jgi:hypothetical protein
MFFRGVPMGLALVGRTPGSRLTPRSASFGPPMKVKKQFSNPCGINPLLGFSGEPSPLPSLSQSLV